MNSKKFFSHDSNINFSDYLKNKNGVEILKNLQTKKTNTIHYFLSYDDFILLTKTFFNYLYLDNPCSHVPESLYDSNTSFIFYEKLISHMKDCNNCRFSRDLLHLYDCKELMGILYPYGEYIETNLTGANLELHTRINVENFANSIPEKNKNCKYCTNTNELNNVGNVYPSQNNFIFDDLKKTDNFEQHLRMNAYAVYPHLKTKSEPPRELKNNISHNGQNGNNGSVTKGIENTGSGSDKNTSTSTDIGTNTSEIKNVNNELFLLHKKNRNISTFQKKNNNEINSNTNNNSCSPGKYNTCIKINKSKSPYEIYRIPKENINKSIIPLKKNAKHNK